MENKYTIAELIAPFSPMKLFRNGFHLLLHLLLSTIAIVVMAQIVPGVHLQSWLSALTVAVVLGLINVTLRPILLILALPINLLTLGLFSIVINAVLLLLVAYIVPGFALASFWTAIIASIVLALINWFFHLFGE